MDRALRRIVIVGGGTAGWMTAAALAHTLRNARTEVRLIESEEIGIVGVGEATLPHIRFFNRKLGISEDELIAATKGTYKLGIEFRDWGRKGESYIHPFGDFGVPMEGVPFHHLWRRAVAAGHQRPIEDYSLPIRLAREDRFAHPDPDPRSIRSTFGYAFQFDASLYAAFLRRWSEARGVVRIEGKIVDVALDPEDGFVRSVKLDRGETIDGDLFVDCSGFRGLLVEQALKTGYEDWTRWLPCDRAVAAPCVLKDSLTPYTRATAREAGWQWRIPLQHRVGNGYVYSSGFISDQDAADALMGRLEGDALADPRPLRFTGGRRKNHWVRNVVAVGLSAGFIEPLESTSIYLIQQAITTLVELLPDRTFDPALAAEFNRLLHVEFERTRDFIVLHYHATTRDDAPLWNYVREMPIPDSLAEKLELWRERGVVTLYKDGPFLEPSWVAVYLGQGVLPKRWDPRADAIDPASLDRRFAALRGGIEAAVAATPRHADFLAARGGATGPLAA